MFTALSISSYRCEKDEMFSQEPHFLKLVDKFEKFSSIISLLTVRQNKIKHAHGFEHTRSVSSLNTNLKIPA